MKRAVLIVAAVYLVGCLLLYFGVAFIFIDRELRPEPDLLRQLVNSAVYVIRPLFAVLFVAWPLFIIIAIPLAFPSVVRDVWRFLKDTWAFFMRRNRGGDD